MFASVHQQKNLGKQVSLLCFSVSAMFDSLWDEAGGRSSGMLPVWLRGPAPISSRLGGARLREPWRPILLQLHNGRVKVRTACSHSLLRLAAFALDSFLSVSTAAPARDPSHKPLASAPAPARRCRRPRHGAVPEMHACFARAAGGRRRPRGTAWMWPGPSRRRPTCTGRSAQVWPCP